MGFFFFFIPQPSEGDKVSFTEKVPTKTVKITFPRTTDKPITVDSVEVDYCATEGTSLKEIVKHA